LQYLEKSIPVVWEKLNDILANVSVAHLSSSRRFDTVPSLLHRVVAKLALSNPASLITGNEGSPALTATPNTWKKQKTGNNEHGASWSRVAPC